MKAGRRPIVLDGVRFAPEHPAYWVVPENLVAAVALLVADGTVEYEPELNRVDGKFAVAPALQTVDSSARGPAQFSRKGR